MDDVVIVAVGRSPVLSALPNKKDTQAAPNTQRNTTGKRHVEPQMNRCSKIQGKRHHFFHHKYLWASTDVNAPIPHHLPTIQERMSVAKVFDRASAKVMRIDTECDCVDHIKASPCKDVFLSAANCHNDMLQYCVDRDLPPNRETCQIQFKQLTQCFEQHGISFVNKRKKGSMEPPSQ